MPRDASGNMTLPSGNPVVDGTVITTDWANPTMADLAAEIEDSLSRSGKGGMLVPFQAEDGTAGAPGYSFTNDVTTGIYRSVAGMGLVVGGALKALLAAAKTTFYDPVQFDNVTIHDDGTTLFITGMGFGVLGEYVEWLGPSGTAVDATTDAAAYYYLKTDGTIFYAGGGAGGGGTYVFTSSSSGLTNTLICTLGPNAASGANIVLTINYYLHTQSTFSGTSAGLTAYNAITKQNPAVELILSRSRAGGAFADVLTHTVTGSHSELAPIPAAGEGGFYMQDANEVFSYTDTDGTTDTREWKLRINSWAVNSTVKTQTMTLRSAE